MGQPETEGSWQLGLGSGSASQARGAPASPHSPSYLLRAADMQLLPALVLEPGGSQTYGHSALSLGTRAHPGPWLDSLLSSHPGWVKAPDLSPLQSPEFTLASVPRGDKLKGFSSLCLAGPFPPATAPHLQVPPHIYDTFSKILSSQRPSLTIPGPHRHHHPPPIMYLWVTPVPSNQT